MKCQENELQGSGLFLSEQGLCVLERRESWQGSWLPNPIMAILRRWELEDSIWFEYNEFGLGVAIAVAVAVGEMDRMPRERNEWVDVRRRDCDGDDLRG
ncbi:hypothetical protein JCGZ_02460 [Jatropha curcas]|uniref:Uncharacterized protein n=1 Tax=Jatropha curcas TaxID=180498 RepID=A0A067JRZ6_JATCU|nr:hypothetical protein JCGZ_02460 [Jatropha curcas]